MGKANLYDMEKVLYFANRPEGLHVSVREEDDTDLSMLVEDAKESGWITRVESDDSGLYYHTTHAGQVKLLELQISWRLRRGKSTRKHREALEKLTAEEGEQ